MTTSSCRNRLIVVDESRRANLRAVLDIPVAIDVGDRLHIAALPSSLIVSAMIALSGSASPARRAAETDSPNHRKHGFGSYSTTWYT